MSSRNTTLDALRGIAALLVVAAHAANALGGPLDRLNQAIFSPGIFGVVLFFGISGRVIPPALERAGGARAFLRRRALRIYPAYLVSVAASALVFGLAPLAWLAHLTMLPDLFGVPRVNGVYWTLYIELFFYVFVCARLPLRASAWAWLALAWLTNWVVPLGIATICAGSARPRAGMTAALAVSWFLIPEQMLGVRVAGALGVLAWAAVADARWSAPRPLVWLGDVSYGVYLLHIPIIATTPPVLWLPLTLAGAWALYVLVERPLMRLGHGPGKQLGVELLGRAVANDDRDLIGGEEIGTADGIKLTPRHARVTDGADAVGAVVRNPQP